MRSEAELQERLQQAVEARRQLFAEEEEAKKQKDALAQSELTEEIANLSGVITTLEWVLQSGVAAEYA